MSKLSEPPERPAPWMRAVGAAVAVAIVVGVYSNLGITWRGVAVIGSLAVAALVTHIVYRVRTGYWLR